MCRDLSKNLKKCPFFVQFLHIRSITPHCRRLNTKSNNPGIISPFLTPAKNASASKETNQPISENAFIKTLGEYHR